jgi:hypothetical protein
LIEGRACVQLFRGRARDALVRVGWALCEAYTENPKQA